MTPRLLFRVAAIAEALTWAFLLTAMFLKYVTRTTDALVPPAGGIHGFVFLCYVAVTVFVWIDRRWSLGTGLVGLASAIVPFATVPFDVVMDRRGRLDGGWRLARGGDTPSGLLEHAQAWVLRRPVVAALAAVVVVSLVFVALLVVGPPVPPPS
jgi:integral membrane protein